MKKVNQLLLIIAFAAIIFSVGIISIWNPDRESSDFENRTLAQMPEITKDTLLSGQFMRDFEAYFADQLYGRDEIIEAYTRQEFILGKAIVNNIVVAGDDWLFNQPLTEDLYGEIDESLANLEELMEPFKGTDVEFFFGAVPNKLNMLGELYPHFIETEQTLEQRKYFMDRLPEGMEGIDLYRYYKESYSLEELKSMYFKTDHHWNIQGAFIGYQKIIEALSEQSSQFTGKPIDQKSVELVCRDNAVVLGSHNRQLYGLSNSADDQACYYEPFFDAEHVSVQARSLWNFDTIFTDIGQIYGTGMKKDEVHYSDIFTWDLPEIIFENQNSDNDLHLLILKDSYGNPIQPFFSQHFEKTSILDIRHYQAMPIADYIEENNVDIVLFLYNDNNLTNRTKMYDFKFEMP